jgi:hypothetical protein
MLGVTSEAADIIYILSTNNPAFISQRNDTARIIITCGNNYSHSIVIMNWISMPTVTYKHARCLLPGRVMRLSKITGFI